MATTTTTLATATRPRTSLGCLYPEAEVAGLRAWMRSGAPGPALATAAAGSGLTTLIQLLVKEAGLDAVWIGCATPRIKALLEQTGSCPVSVTMRRKIVVVDEFDAFGGASGDAAAASDALSFAKSKPPVPMLFVSHSTRSQKSLEYAKAWPKFAMGRPCTLPYLTRVAAEHSIPGVTADQLRDLAARTKGDLRAALMALDLARRGDLTAGGSDTKDETADPLDLTEEVLRGERGRSVAECLRLFAMETAVLPMGLWENYVDSLGKDGADLAAAAAAADGFSAADTVDKYMYSHQAWELLEAYGACAVAAPALSLARLRKSAPKAIKVTKFGSIWSKMYNACAKAKHLKQLNLSRAGEGLQALGGIDWAYVRGIVRSRLQDDGSDDGAVRAACHPLTPAQVLCLARLCPGESTWYKQAWHARVKRLLHDTA